MMFDGYVSETSGAVWDSRFRMGKIECAKSVLLGAVINQSCNSVNRYLYYTYDLVFAKMVEQLRTQNADWDQWSDEQKRQKINLINIKTDEDQLIRPQALTTTLFERYWGFDFSTTATIFQKNDAIPFICQMTQDQSLAFTRRTPAFAYMLTLFYVCFVLCGNKLSPKKSVVCGSIDASYKRCSSNDELYAIHGRENCAVFLFESCNDNLYCLSTFGNILYG